MIDSLEHTDITTIVDCLHEAFSDYALPMKMPYAYWEKRWLMSNIDYSLSYGYFDNEDLKGFILHGIDFWKGEKCFYNMATGVVPAYRRRGILRDIYKTAFEALGKAGCISGYLEVLCNNEKAIKAYEKSGFEIIDEMHCYVIPKEYGKDLQPLGVSTSSECNPSKYQQLIHHELSFEHRSDVIKRQPESFSSIELHENGELAAFAIVKDANGNITQFGFRDNELDRYGESLFSALSQHYNGPRLINISIKDEALHDFFRKNRFQALISQYMMRVRL